ncbi:MAG TPA: ABC transporter permease [Terriglobales bacterium]|nr:ABC transporter permease [Terriglobales bacterium]
MAPRRFLALFRRRRLRAEIREEIDHHLALSHRDDRNRRFGQIEIIQERTREMNTLVSLEAWAQDLRFALRYALRRAPGFTAIVVLSLALGIGANAAIFSLINTVLLKTLPVPDPQQVYFLSAVDGINKPVPDFSYPVIQQMAQAAGPGNALGAASSPAPLPLLQPGAPALRVETQLVSGAYFQTLGLEPLRGRWINPNDNHALGASPVAVLSYAFWQKQFGGDPAILGRVLTLRGVPVSVVGIAPPEFSGLDPSQPVDLWTPLMMQAALHATGNRWSLDGKDDQPWPPQEGEMWLMAFARLAHPSEAAALGQRFTPILRASLRRVAPNFDSMPNTVALAPGGRGGDSLRQAYTAPLQALMAMVALMLLIAIANVATLLLARMVRRRREIAIRLALGISRARLARQLLAEGFVLALLGAFAAIGVAIAASHFMIRLAANPFQPDLDWHLWLFLALVALGTGLALGLLPAWSARRDQTADALKSEGSGATAQGRGRIPLGRWLVIAQVAFSLLLVAAAGLFSRSLAAMFTANLGFDRAHLLTVEVSLPDSGVSGGEVAVLQQRLLERARALPGVRAVALDQSGLDDFSADTSGISLAGRADPPGGLHSDENTVSRDFFAAVGMTLLRGRNFATTDTATAPDVVVVNQAFARRFYPAQDPLGKTFGYSADGTGKFRIIGIVADARVSDPHAAAVPLFYRVIEQSGNSALKLEIRTSGDPAALAAAARAAVPAIDPRLRVRSLSTVSHRLDEMLGRDRLIAQLSGGFAALALALACLGLYGVMAYAVGARLGEFSLRMALGAERRDILAMVLREAAWLLAVGVAAGLGLSLAAGRLLQPLLPGASATDPIALAAAAALMLVLPLLAALRPALRAAATNPATALRG